MQKDEVLYLIGTLKAIQKDTGSDLFMTKEIERYVDSGLVFKLIKKGYVAKVHIQTTKGIVSGLTLTPKSEQEYLESGASISII